MNRIDRLFGIVTLLQSKKYVPADKIAEKFHISIRTVYRDIRAIGEQGIPVSFEPQKGYCIMQGYFIPPISFSTEEANALLLMEAIVSGFADKSIHTYYTNALNKVKAVLRHSQKEKIEALANNIKLQVPSCFRYDFDYLSVIQNAIASCTIIDMQYKNQHDESRQRKVEPIGLVFYALAWHLIGWCRLREGYRDFKVSRIQRLQLKDELFENKTHQSLQEYIDKIIISTHELLEVVVLFKKEVYKYLKEKKYWYGFVREEEVGDCIRMHFLTSSLEMFARWLLSFTNEATVESPQQLVNEMNKMVGELKEIYK